MSEPDSTPWQVLRRALSGRAPDPPRHVLVRWLFLHTLALVFLVAFVDLWSQVSGLLGSRGLLPVQSFLADNDSGALERFFRLPTLFWLDASDTALHAACLAGVVLSVLLLLRIAPAVCLLGLFALYLSFVSTGQIFYRYQWDALLLEAGFAALFLAPWRTRPTLDDEPPPSPWVVWWLRVIVVRVMVSSGGLKLVAGNAPWHDLTALRYHFWTQPLPTWTAWLAHQLPDALLSFGVAFHQN